MTAAQRKGKIEATRTEWQQAIDAWQLLRQSHSTIPTDYLHLSEKQIGLLNQLTTNPKAVTGEPVLIICQSNGGLFSSYPYKGTILKATKVAGDFIIKVMIYPTEHEDWTGEKIEDVKLYQVTQVRKVFIPTADQMKDVRLTLILHTVNHARNNMVRSLQQTIRQYEANKQSYQLEVKKFEKLIKQSELQLNANKTPDLDVKQLESLLNQFGKNKKIKNAILNMEGDMIIETEMLYAIDKAGKERKELPIGKFAFLLSTRGKSYCRVMNLDYEARGYPHPNINSNGEICSGDNTSLIENMAKSGQFYELADFLLIFLSLFPQDGGNPYVSHETWIGNRTARVRSNPFSMANPIWQLQAKKTEDKPRESKKKTAEPTVTEAAPGSLSIAQLRALQQQAIADYARDLEGFRDRYNRGNINHATFRRYTRQAQRIRDAIVNRAIEEISNIQEAINIANNGMNPDEIAF